MLAAVGYESRAIYISQTVPANARKKYALGFLNQQELAYKNNRDWFEDHDYKYDEYGDNDFEAGLDIVETELADQQQISMRIDVSCFNRPRLANLIDFCQKISSQKKLVVDFVYCLAQFTPPSSQVTSNTHVGPVTPSFAGWTEDPSLPPAAVIGVGYEQDRALGAVEHLQAGNVWLFVPQSPVSEYTPAVAEANRSLFSSIRPDRKIIYHVHEPLECYAMLESVVTGLVNSFNPVLLPFGPKIFSVCAMLVSRIHPSISVWRVSASEQEIPSDRKASPHIMGLRVSF